MTRSLQDKVIIITGGASGIGRAAALCMASAGARVAIADIDLPGGEYRPAGGGREASATSREPEAQTPLELRSAGPAARLLLARGKGYWRRHPNPGKATVRQGDQGPISFPGLSMPSGSIARQAARSSASPAALFSACR